MVSTLAVGCDKPAACGLRPATCETREMKGAGATHGRSALPNPSTLTSALVLALALALAVAGHLLVFALMRTPGTPSPRPQVSRVEGQPRLCIGESALGTVLGVCS